MVVRLSHHAGSCAAAALLLAGPAWAETATAQPTLPVTSLLWSLRAMAGSWVLLTLLVAVLAWRGSSLRAVRGRLALWACVLTLPLPWIAMLSGWLVLELGQPSVTAAPAGTDQASVSATVSMLAWGCAYAVLMLLNLKFSLRWLRLEPSAGSAGERRHAESEREGRSQAPSVLVERLSQSYGVGHPGRAQGAPAAGAALQLTHTGSDGAGAVDRDQLTRDIQRLRKERNALRKALKLKPKRGSSRLLTVQPGSAAADGEDDENAPNTQVLPVLQEVVRRRS